MAGANLAEFGLSFAAMASRCEVRLLAPDETTARRWGDAAIAEVRRIEAHFSRYRPDSVVSRINAAAGGAPVVVDDETAALLDFAATLHAQSEGRFDLTSGVLRQAWDFKARRVPDAAQLAQVVARIGWTRVEWRRPRVRLPEAGMELDFGGIGKEYAADRAAGVLQSLGAWHGFVNLGGDVRAMGPQADGTAWRIGIQHPRGPEDVLIGALELSTGAIATSGDYERYFETEGRRYCHIFDPRTGWPVSHWQSVSVAMAACVAAGACSTVAMLMPVGLALEFLQAQGCAYLAVDAKGEVYQRDA
jgi:thiamine biosynthesis lipoprotein